MTEITEPASQPPLLAVWAKLRPHLRWTRSSTILLGTFFLTCFLIVGIWWSLAADVIALVPWDGAWWLYMDWLLLGIFAFMSAVLVIGADVRTDSLIIFVGLCGGLVIESWGTQTDLWSYYTAERPPLWIIPAWPIASLTIDRMVRLLNATVPKSKRTFEVLFYAIFGLFFILMIGYVLPTIDKPMTIGAIVLCAFLIAVPEDHRIAVLTFAAGAGLGYFLELWGTTRLCWTYYTLETPPLFAVLAHGMAGVAFWRAALVVKRFYVQFPPFRRIDALVARIPLGD
jgi:hypothetical protein